MANKKSNAGKIGLAGVVAAGAAAAGAYYLYGSKNAEKNRAKAKAFVKKAEVRIMKEAKKGVKVAQSKIVPAITERIDKEMKDVKKAVKKLKE